MLPGQTPGVVGLGLCVDARRAGSHPTRDGIGDVQHHGFKPGHEQRGQQEGGTYLEEA